MPPPAGGSPHASPPSENERFSGAREGEAFDEQLRNHERMERDERMSRIAGRLGGERVGQITAQPSLGLLALKSDVERLTAYYNAVQNSRVWRLTQRLRRLV